MGPFKNRYGNCKNSDKGYGHFLKSTCDFGDPPSRAPKSHLVLILMTTSLPPKVLLYLNPKWKTSRMSFIKRFAPPLLDCHHIPQRCRFQTERIWVMCEIRNRRVRAWRLHESLWWEGAGMDIGYRREEGEWGPGNHQVLSCDAAYFLTF